MSGGSGTRLWPLSRQSYPKQFLSLFNHKSLFQQTISRVSNSSIFNPAIIIINHEHRFIVEEELQKLNYQAGEIILEQTPKNTAPAIAIGSMATINQSKNNNQQGEDLVIIMPCDHLIQNDNLFIEKIKNLIKIDFNQILLTFGIKPQYAESGYGYIERENNPLFKEINSEDSIYKVKSFIEKPSKIKAEELIKNQLNLWNSGIFAFRASFFLDELKKFCPDIFEKCKNSYLESSKDLNFTRLGSSFEKVENISIDYAIIEKSKNVAVLPVNIDWNDVGSWKTVADISKKDNNGNSLIGKAYSLNSQNCYVHSLKSITTIIGVDNLLIINLKDTLLIANKNNAQQVKEMVEILQKQNIEEVNAMPKKFRPWGSFEIIDVGNNFKLKKIIVKPHSALSLQLHNHRSEHWIVVNGVAKVIKGDQFFTLNTDESTYIKSGTKHRIINDSNNILEIIEVQTGKYLEEDDITRFEDLYGR